jgi:glycosyltransferase involved in cell wall biosynthesis
MEYAIRQVGALVGVANGGGAEQNTGRKDVDVIFVCRPSFPMERLPFGSRVEALPATRLCGLGKRRGILGRLAQTASMIRDLRRRAKLIADLTEKEIATFQQGAAVEVRILYACYKEYFSPLWVGRLRQLARKGVVIGTIAHDPVRDFAVGPRWWHRCSVRMGYSFVRDVFVHDNTSVDFGGRKPPGIRVHRIPHGPYEVAPPKTGREATRSRYGFSQDYADVVLLAFGQIRDGKNLDLFLRAMAKLPANVKLLVVGQGGSGSSKPPEFYQEMAQGLRIADRCSWDIRRISDAEVGDVFAACDFVLLTYGAQFRSASGVLNVAVSARKPVLASSGEGPLKTAVQEYGLGLWIEPDSEDAIVDGVRSLMTAAPQPRWEDYDRENSWDRNAEIVVREMGS